ncbi:MAG: hypothetical protein JEZ06_02730 [Anaerolineaceae bacterium]|nr:hypothetical protein [Anaerolineaceae bacterium]
MGNEKEKLVSEIKYILLNTRKFVEVASGLKLRKYQVGVAEAVVDSVINNKGLSFVVMFPRQSGKNELQAQLEAYLLTLLSQTQAEIVKVSPTWKPQTLNAMRRLQRVLEQNILVKNIWKKESGYIFKIGTARIFFFSGNPEANIVGATAGTLLEIDEAQDILISKFDKDIAPMAASTNATRIYWGTAWTSRTLLARELRAAREAQQRDGIKRVFVLTANEVGKEVPAYKKFVKEQVEKLGRNHPMIKTQYYSEEIDAEGGMFNQARQALMQGEHPPAEQPESGKLYALLVDLAGEDEGATDDITEMDNPSRDATAITVVEVDLTGLNDGLTTHPKYLVKKRYLWTGKKQILQYAELKAIAAHWKPRKIVIDATGIGAGLAAFMEKSYPEEVIKYVFTSSSKSKLGWDFLAVCDTGRFKDHQKIESDNHQAAFWTEVENCEYAVRDGPGKLLSWSVPEGTRDQVTGDLVHDDLLISAAMTAALDWEEWFVVNETMIIDAPDPLNELDQGF